MIFSQLQSIIIKKCPKKGKGARLRCEPCGQGVTARQREGVIIIFGPQTFYNKEFDRAMLLKHSCSSYSAARLHSSPQPRLGDPLPPSRQAKVFSQRPTHAPAATKRLLTLETPRSSLRSKTSRLTFSKNLFREARKVDPLNPRESFLPANARLPPDNSAKLHTLLSMHSKLQGRARGGSALQKGSRCERGEREGEGRRREAVLQAPLSSLTRLILNECNAFGCENVPSLEIGDSSLHIPEEDAYAQWINLLCASSAISHRQQCPTEQQFAENPYQLPVRKVGVGRRQVQESEYFRRA